MIIVSDNLKAALRKNANAYLIINVSTGVVLALFGIVTIVSGWIAGTPESRIWIVLAGLIMLATGVATAWYYWKTRVDVVALLEEHPERVVWVYKQISTGTAYGLTVARFSFVVFGLDDKHRVAVRLPAQDADRLIEELNAQLHHATFGYSAELERRYRNNPQDLRRR